MKSLYRNCVIDIRYPRGLAFLGGMVLASFATVPVHADPGRAPSHSQAQQLVQDTTTRVLAAVVENREVIQRDRQRLYALVDEIVLPHFDFRRMSIRVLAKHWRRASPDQRQQFVEQFKILLVRTYATALEQYTGQEIKILPVRSPPDAKQVNVRMELKPSGGVPVPINYAMYRRGDHWQVYDVAVDGVSLIINYRSSFGAEIRKTGIDGLIERLARRNQWDEQNEANPWGGAG